MSIKIIHLFLIVLSITLISTKTAEAFLNCVRAQLGKPYVYGAEGPNTFDCSGLAFYCFDGKIPRSSFAQSQSGQRGDGSPGDLVFFGNPGGKVSHVGVSIGGGKMIHAPDVGQVVQIRNYKDSTYTPRYKGSRRYWSGSGSSSGSSSGSGSSSSSGILDLYFYKHMYSDLESLSDTDAINHWNTFGIKEGRAPCLYYSPEFYVNNNADLKSTFGNDWKSLYNHFISYGIKELRNSSPVYDGNYYKHYYSDLVNLDGQSLINHFMEFGIKEGRRASKNFDVASYRAKNPDLVSVYGNDLKHYYYHYLFHGIEEGRAK